MSSLQKFFAYQIYRILLAPTARFLLQTIAPFLPEKIQLIVKERESLNWVPLLSSPVWIHAASGEIEYAKSVTRELKKQFPEQPILVTYFSPSAKPLLKNLEGADHIMPLPWDSSKEVEKFLNFFKPKALLIARTDLWPTFLNSTKKRKIPTLLFSATYTKAQVEKNFFSRWLLQYSLECLQSIFVVSSEDKENLSTLTSAEKIFVAGDTRFDQVFYRLNQTKESLKSELKPALAEKVFIAGSTWPEDEEILLPAMSQLISMGYRPILVPHEVQENHLLQIEKALGDQSLLSCRYSKTSLWDKNQILIIDQVGLLAELYSWGTAAFVGGSFRAKVHSVMEPLAAGLFVFVGPFHANNREAVLFQKIIFSTQTPLVQKFSESKELTHLLSQLKSNESTKTEVIHLVKKHQGATKLVINWLIETFKKKLE